MRREEDYMDQLFKDHFEDFGKSPSDMVWKGVMANGSMANGKGFILPGGWKSGATLLMTVILSLFLMSGSDSTKVMVEDLDAFAQKVQNPTGSALAVEAVTASSAEVQAASVIALSMPAGTQAASFKLQETNNNLESTSDSGIDAQGVPIEASNISSSANNSSLVSQVEPTEPNTAVENSEMALSSTAKKVNFEHLLKLTYMPGLEGLADTTRQWLAEKDSRLLKKGLFGATYFTNEERGEWFVTGGLVMDGTPSHFRGSVANGLVFGAGKFINKNSFIEVALRGTFGNGFSMRATYTHLLLPGKIRPFIQAGLAWGTDLDARVGAGVLYEPSPLSKWRLFASASYEKGSQLFEGNSKERAILELGVQLRLSGTEPILSDNNWMNSIPHYTVPDKWYLEGSSNFAFFDKTKVTRLSFYGGKYLSRRLFVRGGVRLGRDRIILPTHLQYHMIARQKLRFGVYAGPSLDVNKMRLGAELGLIAYYEVLPGWSLFVAPVLLENSAFEQRIFETGISYYLGSKKKK